MTITRKLKPGLGPSEARGEVQDLLAWRPLSIDSVLMENAWVVEDRFGLSFWDALIVSAAKLTDCRFLLTEDLQSGQDLDGLKVISPFDVSPIEINALA